MRFRVIPHLSEKNSSLWPQHIIPVTIISILFVITGVSFRNRVVLLTLGDKSRRSTFVGAGALPRGGP